MPIRDGKHVDPALGCAPLHEWGSECARGWVRDDRFGSGQVIKGTNRGKTREIYRSKGKR